MTMPDVESKDRPGDEFVPYLEAYERYLLKERGGMEMPAMAFLRETVKGIINTFAAGIPNIRGKKKADILILHHNHSSVDKGMLLSNALLQHFSVRNEFVDLEFVDQILRLKFGGFKAFKGTGLPARYKYLACYCSYLIERYDPEIIITLINGGLFPAVLKVATESYGRRLINISHAITGMGYMFSAFTFDYYFTFGKSSVKNISSTPLRLGSTKAVIVGSPFITSDFKLPVCVNRKNILFFSQWVKPETREIVLMNLEILSEWAAGQDKFSLYIKPHPLEDISLIKKFFEKIESVTILDKKVSFKEALSDIALCITQWSVASVEAAVLLRPTICLNASDQYDEFLELEKFFGTKARSSEELDRRIHEAFSNYDHYVHNCAQYVNQHLEHVTDSIPTIVQRIRSIYAGREDFDFQDIPQKVDIL